MTRNVAVLALAAWLVLLGTARAYEPVGPPAGKWERKVGKNQVTLVIEANRLHVTLNGEKSCTVHADLSMTKDQILYGVVTSVESADDNAAEVEKEMLDAPFSCRFRIDEGQLIVRDVKFGGGEEAKDNLWAGRFKLVSPPPAPVQASAGYGVSLRLTDNPQPVVPPPAPGRR